MNSNPGRASNGNSAVVNPKTVAVVVPLSNKPGLIPEEEISLRHLLHHLGRYDKYVVAPTSLPVDFPGFGVKRFGDGFFGSVEAHSRLMLSPQFYEAFSDYKYILTYHLDALALSDQLLEWCATDYDFIGGPARAGNPLPSVVGNGGFALRKVESFLKVFYSDRYAVDPAEYWKNFCENKPRIVQLLNLPRKYLKHLRYFNSVRSELRYELRRGHHHEDIFINLNAQKYYPEFKIPPVEVALRFAFDEVPKLCFELTKGQLPFGCHGWYKWDREFWEPYLLR